MQGWIEARPTDLAPIADRGQPTPVPPVKKSLVKTIRRPALPLPELPSPSNPPQPTTQTTKSPYHIQIQYRTYRNFVDIFKMPSAVVEL